MKDLTVSKGDLVTKIEANRTEHRANYEKAFAGYRDEVESKTADALTALRNKEIEPHEFRARLYALYCLPVPEDHTADYEAVLDMLSFETAPTVVISPRDFRAYARDEWDWKEAWVATSSNYAAVS